MDGKWIEVYLKSRKGSDVAYLLLLIERAVRLRSSLLFTVGYGLEKIRCDEFLYARVSQVKQNGF